MPKHPDPQGYEDEPRPPISLNAVESRQVRAIGYDPETKTIAVQFMWGAGAIYHYPDVDGQTFRDFASAESKGTFFGKNVKGLPFKKYPPDCVSTHKEAGHTQPSALVSISDSLPIQFAPAPGADFSGETSVGSIHSSGGGDFGGAGATGSWDSPSPSSDSASDYSSSDSGSSYSSD